MEELKENNVNISPEVPKKDRFYKKPWVRITALILALVMIFSIWANGATQVRIRKSHELDAAVNYLVENTDYVNEKDLKRLQEKLLAYQKATELEDYYRLAGTQIAQEAYDEALISIDKCIELYPGEDEALYVDLLLKRACLLVLLVREDDALEALDRVLEYRPDHADAYLIKAQIYAERNDLEALAQVLSSYLNCKPDEHSIRMVYAQTLFELQRYEEAIGEYQYLLENESGQLGKGELWYLLGLTQLQLSHYGESEIALQQAKLLNPELDGLDYYIGICQMSREAYADAVASFTRAIAVGSMLQHSYYSRGVCRMMLEEDYLDAAIEDLQAASGYAGADADSNVKHQADDLLAQLQDVITAP